MSSTIGAVARWSFRPPFRLQNLFAQLDFVGVGSIFLVSLTGMFTGMVFAHQTSRAFELFDAESLVGPTVALTITRELGPVFTALMVTMRAGSAMCTELGTMRVTEQVDALETIDRKSTRLNSSHSSISYAVFCLKKKNNPHPHNSMPRRLRRPSTTA